MPIYEYECPLCGTFEVMHGASEKPLKKKPDCKEGKCPCAAKRLVSASSFKLVGSGWYKTDYAAGSSTSNGGTGKKPKSETKSESSPKSDSGACGSGCGCHSAKPGKAVSS
jgi:putative FmdB family regulatory protein